MRPWQLVNSNRHYRTMINESNRRLKMIVNSYTVVFVEWWCGSGGGIGDRNVNGRHWHESQKCFGLHRH
jgi:hypothetical protein